MDGCSPEPAVLFWIFLGGCCHGRTLYGCAREVDVPILFRGTCPVLYIITGVRVSLMEHMFYVKVCGLDIPELEKGLLGSSSSCRDQKAVKFQVKIDPSALKKTHYENITLNSKKNLTLANAALGRY
ncbi:MAG: hypothetical protein Q8M94_07865 [Ignavibacteria bacterium]|nr:hypothetical protein [Ignavibacteria bacterium]